MKVYEKPRITIEQFTLSQHVADCGWELQAGNEDSCIANPDPEWNLGVPDGTKMIRNGTLECRTEQKCF